MAIGGETTSYCIDIKLEPIASLGKIRDEIHSTRLPKPNIDSLVLFYLELSS